jgi:hypothetical protein
MSATHKYNFLKESYISYFLHELERVNNGNVTLDTIKLQLRSMESKIDELAEDSEFFDLERAQTLLGWSEAIIQDFPSYEENVQKDLLAAISYFVNEDDAIKDNDPVMGLDDDFEVMKGIIDYHQIKLI